MKKHKSILSLLLLCIGITLSFMGCTNNLGKVGETVINSNGISFYFSFTNIYNTKEIKEEHYTILKDDIDKGIVTEIILGEDVAYVKIQNNLNSYSYKVYAPSAYIFDIAHNSKQQIKIIFNDTNTNLSLLAKDNITIIEATFIVTNNSNTPISFNMERIKLSNQSGLSYIPQNVSLWNYEEQSDEYILYDTVNYIDVNASNLLDIKFILPLQKDNIDYKIEINNVTFAITKSIDKKLKKI